jgi:hypothetical protein
MVYIGDTGGAVASLVLKVSKWNVNRTNAPIEITSFLDANKTYVQGLPDLKFTFDAFWDDTESKPFHAAAASSPVNVYLYPSADSISHFWSGPAWLDLSMDVPVAGAIVLACSGVAAGSWSNTF